MAEAAIRSKQRETSGARSDAGLPPLKVSYYSRMKQARVYPVTVSWPQDGKGGGGKKITVRLLAAGAQVVPSEHTIEPAATATFYVTPLARGWLGAERVEVLHEGRKIQEIPMATNVVSRRSVCVLLFLTIFLPWFILTYLKYGPIRDDISHADAAGNKLAIPNVIRIERFIYANLPALPDVEFVRDQKWLQEGYNIYVPQLLAGTIGDIIRFSREQPLAFIVFCVFLVLTLLAALTTRDKTKRAWSKRLVVED
ncbi:MAG: hypothetical protein HY040_05415 [Planctomycetes bacterium]|nr:hypothetical protein [Planctomycetota bacterium]